MSHPDEAELLPLKVPPHSTEAEQCLLGALLLDNAAFEKVSWLSEKAFYEDRHRRLWRCLSKMIEAGKVADMLTVSESLGDDLERVGGPAYLGSLCQSVPSSLNIRRYAELVDLRAVQRELITAGTEIAEEAFASGVQEAGPLLDQAEARLMRITERQERHGTGPQQLPKLLSRNFERIDTLYRSENKSGITGIPSGFADLDAKTAGLQPSDLIIVAGRPSMGKTAIALNMAEYVAMDAGLPVAIFSMEMSGEQLSQRLLGSVARVDQHKMRTGKLDDEEWGRLSAAMAKLHDAPIEIDDTGGLTATEIRSRARAIKRQRGKLGLVVVDYLQLMDSKSRGENRATEISEITRSLKTMAKELRCPVIALSQLNRALEKRDDRRPNMADLRDSGAIEQDADVILFVYRHEHYFPEMPEAAGWAELIIGKQRNGPVGKVDLTFLGAFTRFEDRAHGAPFIHTKRGSGKVRSMFDGKSAAAGPDAA